MKLYIRVENNFINYVDVEENNVCNEEVEANSLDEMFIELEKLGNIDEETENKISELFESEVNKESLTSYNIKHWVSNRSFGELIDMFNCGEIKKPAMQREFIWDAQKSSRLIESIILGLPIPLVAGLGYLSVFGSSTNTLLAPIFIGVEVFGPANALPYAIVMAFAYLINHKTSIYGQQKMLEMQ